MPCMRQVQLLIGLVKHKQVAWVSCLFLALRQDQHKLIKNIDMHVPYKHLRRRISINFVV